MRARILTIDPDADTWPSDDDVTTALPSLRLLRVRDDAGDPEDELGLRRLLEQPEALSRNVYRYLVH